MSGLRIAYIINSMEGGGAQSPLPLIVRTLEDAGARVRVLALTRRDGRAIARLRAHGVEPLVRSGGESDHRAAMRWLHHALDDFAPDVVWTSLTRATLLGQMVGARRGLPVISWQHNAFLKKGNAALLRLRARRSALWVADSDLVAQLTRRRLKVPADRLITWPIFAADPAAPRARPWNGVEPVRLGTLGRLHPNKGYDILIRALARLEEIGGDSLAPFEVVIAGAGRQEHDLRAACAERGLGQVRFTGYRADACDFLAGLHLYLQPSRREGFCIAAHEAMQAGLPVIVSSTGEMQHTASCPTLGRVVPTGCAEGLARALAELLADPARLHAMGQAARDHVNSCYSRAAFARTGAQIVTRLEGLCANPAPARPSPAPALCGPFPLPQ